jgi:hypothetical protein
MKEYRCDQLNDVGVGEQNQRGKRHLKISVMNKQMQAILDNTSVSFMQHPSLTKVCSELLASAN